MENEGIRETLIRKLEICIFSLEQERFHCHYPFYDSKEIKEIQRNLGAVGKTWLKARIKKEPGRSFTVKLPDFQQQRLTAFGWLLRLSRSLSQFETQDIKTQPQFNHYIQRKEGAEEILKVLGC